MINIKTFLISAKILYLINYHAYATYTNLNLSGSNTIITGGNFPVVGNITSSSGAPTLTINIGAENWEITSNILAPILTVIKTGSSMLTLSGTNTYTGVTTISAGTLQICSGSTTGSINSNGISNNGDLIFNRFDAYPYSGVISGTGAVTKSGAGILTLSGANTYTGTTTVSAGILN
ncbi:MAG: autotransporter-associated beta strand repeat-containing protein, partial [Pseudomonadota bacterium]